MGGLGAACWLKQYGEEFVVVDGGKELPRNLHNGVHYLHNIPYLPFKTEIKSITLTDGILEHGEIHNSPNLMHSLKYSAKVREIQHPSSIMDVGKNKEVFIPKTNTINSLIDQMAEYIGSDNLIFDYWLKNIDTEKKIAYFRKEIATMDTLEIQEELSIYYENIITTIPLDILGTVLDNKLINSLELKTMPVYITNFKVIDIVPNWLINLYIPERYSPIYRASILNNVCSIESMKELDKFDIKNAIDMFFMFSLIPESAEKYTWQTGKIVSISMDDRMKVVETLKENSTYSLGRFGLWNRKLLMDSTINQAKEVVEFLCRKKEWKEIISTITK